MIQKQMKIRIIYILQPTVTWTERKPTNFEKKIIKYERDRIKEYFQKDFTSKKVYKETKSFLRKCKKIQLNFTMQTIS